MLFVIRLLSSTNNSTGRSAGLIIGRGTRSSATRRKSYGSTTSRFDKRSTVKSSRVPRRPRRGNPAAPTKNSTGRSAGLIFSLCVT